MLVLASATCAILVGVALQCVLWFAAYKAGLLLTAAILAVAAMIFSWLASWLAFEKISADIANTLTDYVGGTPAKATKRVRVHAKVKPA